MSYRSKNKIWHLLEKMSLENNKETKRKIRNELQNITVGDLSLDYSGQNISSEVMSLLCELAKQSGLPLWLKALEGPKLDNKNFKISCLYPALRASEESAVYLDRKNIVKECKEVRETMFDLVNQIRTGQWLGHTDNKITDVVHLGIGGSILGPLMTLVALGDYISTDIGFHFISEVSPHVFEDVTANLNPETTLFIVASKSFLTKETLSNLKKAIHWLKHQKAVEKQIIAITSYTTRPIEYGIKTILPLGKWVVGRFSVTSVINLITCIAIGIQNYESLLLGAREMDKHFFSTELDKNMPVVMALAGIYNNNFKYINNLLVLTYGQNLEEFVPFIQQLEMESNGKSVSKEGKQLDYNTVPIVWGGSGDHAQHSYQQLLLQGTHKIALDLITVDTNEGKLINKIYNNLLMSIHEGKMKHNAPLNHLSIKKSGPKAIGNLIALYEHKVYVQSIIWNINPFIQTGVDEAKKLL